MRLLMKNKPFLDPAVLTNYCSVPNTLSLGKVVERVVAEQLQVVLDDAFLLDPFQSIFHPGFG